MAQRTWSSASRAATTCAPRSSAPAGIAIGGYGWRGYRRWGYWGPYAGPYYGDVWTRRYLEGALTVDIVERTSGALVYRAQVTDAVGKNLDKSVANAMDKAFKKFPVKELSK